MSEENFDIRHVLAVERTLYSNERTFLAYVRTSLALIITGLSFLGFGTTRFLEVFAWIFIPSGIFILLLGAITFHKRRKRIKIERKNISHFLRS